jgi:DNA-binding response OmpR family regulator
LLAGVLGLRQWRRRLGVGAGPGEGAAVLPVVAVIEDDETTRGAMCEALAAEGYATVGCRDFAGAYTLIRARRPAVVVLDVWLAGRTLSLDMLDRLRADPATAATAVLVCSADARALAMHAALLQARGCEALAKPFDLGEFLAMVARLAGPPGGGVAGGEAGPAG